MEALIREASRGLGRALARALAEEGWGLVLDARGAAELDAIAAALDAVTPRARPAAPEDAVRRVGVSGGGVTGGGVTGGDMAVRAGRVAVPALLRLAADRPSSGRHTAAGLVAAR